MASPACNSAVGGSEVTAPSSFSRWPKAEPDQAGGQDPPLVLLPAKAPGEPWPVLVTRALGVCLLGRWLLTQQQGLLHGEKATVMPPKEFPEENGWSSGQMCQQLEEGNCSKQLTASPQEPGAAPLGFQPSWMLSQRGAGETLSCRVLKGLFP